jgi:pimeloyl-ACP methyl ester carboxylesterase
MIDRLACMIAVVLIASGIDCSHAELPAPAPDSLAPLLWQFLDTGDSDEADRLLHILLSRADVSISSVTQVLQADRPYQNQSMGVLPDEHVTVRGRPYRLSLSIPRGYQPAKQYGLVVCLHGAGFTGEEYLERWQARLGEDYVLACPTYPAGAWFTRRAEELVLATIRDVERHYHVDPDRIFLTGMSNGGIGTWLIGMHHAPLFAGIAPMASGLDDVLLPFLANLRNTPVYMIHGATDQVMPVELSRSIARELGALGYPHVYREHQREHPIAGGHYFPREELPDLVKWMERQRREPLPTRLTVVREGSRFEAFSWVRIEATDRIAAFSDDLIDRGDEWIKRREYAKLDAAIVGPNRIEVKAERIRRYSVFLNDRLIDTSKPLTVLTNGRVSFEGPVAPSVEILLRQVRLRQDVRHLFSVHLTIQVPSQAS